MQIAPSDPAKIKKLIKVLTFMLPLIINQARAVENPDVKTSKLPDGTENSLQVESFGGNENFSTSEWEVMKRFRRYSLSSTKERFTLYGKNEIGEIIEVPGETIMGEHGGGNFPLVQMNQVEQIAPHAQFFGVHDHPINSYSNVYWKVTPQPASMSDSEKENAGQEFISKIRSQELYSAWPPSVTDVIQVVLNNAQTFRVVDSNGIWTIGLDRDTKVGDELAHRGDFQNKFLEKMREYGYSEQDALNYLHPLIEANEGNIAPDEKLQAYIEAGFKASNEVSSLIMDDYPEELRDYQNQQMKVAVPSGNRNEWEAKIHDFISYCHNHGLRVVYTLFPREKGIDQTN